MKLLVLGFVIICSCTLTLGNTWTSLLPPRNSDNILKILTNFTTHSDSAFTAVYTKGDVISVAANSVQTRLMSRDSLASPVLSEFTFLGDVETAWYSDASGNLWQTNPSKLTSNFQGWQKQIPLPSQNVVSILPLLNTNFDLLLTFDNSQVMLWNPYQSTAILQFNPIDSQCGKITKSVVVSTNVDMYFIFGTAAGCVFFYVNGNPYPQFLQNVNYRPVKDIQIRRSSSITVMVAFGPDLVLYDLISRNLLHWFGDWPQPVSSFSFTLNNNLDEMILVGLETGGCCTVNVTALPTTTFDPNAVSCWNTFIPGDAVVTTSFNWAQKTSSQTILQGVATNIISFKSGPISVIQDDFTFVPIGSPSSWSDASQVVNFITFVPDPSSSFSELHIGLSKGEILRLESDEFGNWKFLMSTPSLAKNINSAQIGNLCPQKNSFTDFDEVSSTWTPSETILNRAIEFYYRPLNLTKLPFIVMDQDKYDEEQEDFIMQILAPYLEALNLRIHYILTPISFFLLKQNIVLNQLLYLTLQSGSGDKIILTIYGFQEASHKNRYDIANVMAYNNIDNTYITLKYSDLFTWYYNSQFYSWIATAYVKPQF